jgi:uncharacterized protein YbaP (TraB family)
MALRTFLCMWAWLAMAGAAHAATCPPPLPNPSDNGTPRDRGLLWKATRDGRALYLYGTLHVGKPQWKRLGPATAAALKASDTLALEVDPNDPDVLKAMNELRHPREVPPELQQRLSKAFERACMASEALATLHPVLQATMLTMMEARWLGMDSGYAMEQVLIGAAKPARKLVALESALQQLQALVPAEDAEANSALDQSLQQLEDQSARRVLARLAVAWEEGNLAVLEAYEQWCECADSEADRAYMRKLNDERNAGLAAGIEAQHKARKRVFAAVGALHMTGAQSLPKLLEQQGFKVERVPFRR